MDISSIAGKDAPTVFNENGHGQSKIDTRFDLVDGKAMFAMASVLHEGAVKYGAENWRGIDISDHLNHLIMHAYAYLAGDRSDEHLSHIMCRAMFAQAVEIAENESLAEPPDSILNVNVHPEAIFDFEGERFNNLGDLIRHIDGIKSGPKEKYVINPDKK